MPQDTNAIGRRLAKAREARGISQPALAEIVGVKQQAISAIESGKVQRPRKLREIARAVGVTEEYLLNEPATSGISPRGKRALAEMLTISPPDPDLQQAFVDFINSLPDDDHLDEPTIVPIHEAERNGGDEHGESFGTAGGWRSIPGSIPEIDASPGAGEGVVGEIVNFSIGSETYSAHPVNAEWVIPPTTLGPRFGMVSSSSLVMLVRGDSMEPTFRSGDPVGVDLRVKSFEGDGIYVFSEPGEAPQIKRLQKVPLSEPRKVRIISDNKTYETDIVELGSIIIHGRVKLTVLPK